MFPPLAIFPCLADLADHFALREPKPKIGQPPARINYFTVETASGKRVVSTQVPVKNPARDAQTSGPVTGGAISDDYTF